MYLENILVYIQFNLQGSSPSIHTHKHTHFDHLLSVPFGSLPPHVLLSLAVDDLVQLLVVVLHGVHVSQVPHTQRDAHQSKRHHRFVLQNNRLHVTEQGLKDPQTVIVSEIQNNDSPRMSYPYIIIVTHFLID